MFTFKPKKVFEKLNKMDRKQAYTIGAIAVVLIVALLMLVSAVTGGDDDSFDGMNPHGYDLAQLPFATDAAEQYLLAAKYPDMQENGSTLLYKAEDKEKRQEEDAQNAADEAANEMDAAGRSSDEEANWAGSSGGRGYGGYGGRGGSGRGSTEIGQLSSAGMASSGGSGINSTYGPSGDFRQFKGRENRGNEAQAQFKTADARQALAQFRHGSEAAARINENKMRNMGKAIFGGNIQGSDAFGKDGVDLSKLQNGGLTLDTSAPATTTDLDNLDKKVADAAKKAEDKKKEEQKRKWWEDMLIDLAKQAASSLVSSFMDTAGDAIKGAINGQSAYYNARREASNEISAAVKGGMSYNDAKTKYGLTEDEYNTYKNKKPGAAYRSVGKGISYNQQQGSAARTEVRDSYYGTTHSSTQIGQKDDGKITNPCSKGTPKVQADGTIKCEE